MTSLPGLLRGGESGSPAVVPGKPEKSHLLELISPTTARPRCRKAARRWRQAISISSAAGSPMAPEDDSPSSPRPDFRCRSSARLFSRPRRHVARFLAGRKAACRGRVSRGASLEGRRIGPRRAACGHVGSNRNRAFLPRRHEAARRRRQSLPQWRDPGVGRCLAQTPCIDVIGFDTLYGGSWSPDGKLIAVGGADNALRAFDAETFKQVVFMAAHR